MVKSEFIEHPCRRDHSRCVGIAGVRPLGMKVRRQYARWQPGRSHSNQDRVCRALDLQQVKVIGERTRRDGHLHDFRSRGAHRADAFHQIRRNAVEIVAGQDDPSPARRRDQIRGEGRLELEVDVLGAMLDGALENAPALRLAVLKGAAFPRGPACDDDRRLPPG
jgi:hypothetical protein